MLGVGDAETDPAHQWAHTLHPSGLTDLAQFGVLIFQE